MTIGSALTGKGERKMPNREEYIEILSKVVKTVKRSNEDTPMQISLECIEDILELLKEQEPVKPVNVRWKMGINGGNCPKCMNWVQRTYNYCPFCGKEVKWE